MPCATAPTPSLGRKRSEATKQMGGRVVGTCRSRAQTVFLPVAGKPCLWQLRKATLRRLCNKLPSRSQREVSTNSTKSCTRACTSDVGALAGMLIKFLKILVTNRVGCSWMPVSYLLLSALQSFLFQLFRELWLGALSLLDCAKELLQSTQICYHSGILAFAYEGLKITIQCSI